MFLCDVFCLCITRSKHSHSPLAWKKFSTHEYCSIFNWIICSTSFYSMFTWSNWLSCFTLEMGWRWKSWKWWKNNRQNIKSLYFLLYFGHGYFPCNWLIIVWLSRLCLDFRNFYAFYIYNGYNVSCFLFWLWCFFKN